jgi:hypothetical protein
VFQARDEIGGAERPFSLLGRSQGGKSGIVGPFGDQRSDVFHAIRKPPVRLGIIRRTPD